MEIKQKGNLKPFATFYFDSFKKNEYNNEWAQQQHIRSWTKTSG